MRCISVACLLAVCACSHSVARGPSESPAVIGDDNLDRGDSEPTSGTTRDDAVDWDTVSIVTESAFSDCPTVPEQLTGDGKAGTACDTAADCLPVCCDCPSAAKHYLAAACVDGSCTGARTCRVAEITERALCSDDLNFGVPDLDDLGGSFL